MTVIQRITNADPASDGSPTALPVWQGALATLAETNEADIATHETRIDTAEADIAVLEADTHADEHTIGGASHTGTALFSQMPAIYARVSADRSFTTTTLGNVTDGTAALEISSTYKFAADVLVDGPTGGDIKIAFTVPAGSTIKWTGIGGDVTTPATLVATFVAASGTSASYGTLGAGTTNTIRVTGTIRTSTTAGNLQLQAAQVAATGTSKVLIDTDILAWKVA